jgi:hypothetical protein
VIAATIHAQINASFNYQVLATNLPTSYSITGQPAGVTISNTGLISGTPRSLGTYNATVTATNNIGSGSARITIVVETATSGSAGDSPVRTQTITVITPVSSIFVGDSLQLTGTASSGLPLTYSLVSGDGLLSGSTVTFTGTTPVVIRAAQAGNATWAAATSDTTFPAAVKRAQQITAVTPVPAKTFTDSGTMKLDLTSSSGLPITYSVVSGPATISGNTLTFTGSGAVVIRATQAGNGTYDTVSTTYTVQAAPVPRLVNISTRVKVSANDANGATIAGFVVTGSSAKQMLVRAVGPSLSSYGIGSPLADPTLKIFDSTGKVIATNSGWNNDAQIATAADGVGAFKLNAGSKDAAVLISLQPGTYTAQVQSATNSGTVLIEVYDVTANAAVPTKQLVNISTRAAVGTGDDVVVGGFVVAGNDPKRVLIRAVGPGLTAYGVTGVLNDPMLKLYSGSTVVAQNDNWGTAQTVTGSTLTPATAAEITAADTASGAFPLTTGSSDAAIVATLAPGTYSVIVSGANNSTGSVLLEVYELPNP